MPIYVINLRKIGRGILAIFLVITLILVAIPIFGILNRGSNSVFASAEPETGRVIVIDAGHGGEDPGAIGVSGVYEKDLNLEISMILGEMLKEKGYTVLYTRTEDKMLYAPEENLKGRSQGRTPPNEPSPVCPASCGRMRTSCTPRLWSRSVLPPLTRREIGRASCRERV